MNFDHAELSIRGWLQPLLKRTMLIKPSKYRVAPGSFSNSSTKCAGRFCTMHFDHASDHPRGASATPQNNVADASASCKRQFLHVHAAKPCTYAINYGASAAS